MGSQNLHVLEDFMVDITLFLCGQHHCFSWFWRLMAPITFACLCGYFFLWIRFDGIHHMFFHHLGEYLLDRFPTTKRSKSMMRILNKRWALIDIL